MNEELIIKNVIWRCPKCGKEKNTKVVCEKCGFDSYENKLTSSRKNKFRQFFSGMGLCALWFFITYLLVFHTRNGGILAIPFYFIFLTGTYIHSLRRKMFLLFWGYCLGTLVTLVLIIPFIGMYWTDQALMKLWRSELVNLYKRWVR